MVAIIKRKYSLFEKVVLGFLTVFCVAGVALILLDDWAGRNDVTPYPASSVSKSDDSITPDRMQSGVRAMADFMVKDNNVIGLRMWARSLDTSAPDFASAATLRANISRASNDFALYRDTEELTRLVELLGNQDVILDEVLR